MENLKNYEIGLYEEYQRVLSMTEEEVMTEYEESKDNIIREYEALIADFEKNDETEYGDMIYNIDPAFSSFESVNSMFV